MTVPKSELTYAHNLESTKDLEAFVKIWSGEFNRLASMYS